MNNTTGVSGAWAMVMILVIPAVIIVAAEVDERMRQRESPLRDAVLMLRNWTLPFFAVWAVLVPILGVERNTAVVIAAGSGLVLSIGAASLRALRVLVEEITSRPRAEGRGPVPQLLLALPRLALILTTGWILIGSVWGVDLSAALTALGVTSLVISFALQDTLSGLASGILLLSDPPFQPGDWIEAGEIKGVVVDVNWRTSRIRDRNGDIIIVPNFQLAGSSIVNYSSPDPLHRVVVPVQVAFKSPPTLAKAMLLDAALGIPGVLADPPPDVVVVQIDDPLMGYEVRMWIDDYTIAPRVKSDFGALVWYQSYRHDVPLPSPAQDLYLWDGVVNDTAGDLSIADLRHMLERAPMLSSLTEGDLDRLANASRPARFSIGEFMLDSRTPTRDVLIVLEGQASLVVVGDDGPEHAIGDLREGEIIDLAASAPRDGGDIALRAQTDCEVLIIDAEVLGEVGSRNAGVADAFNRVSSVRRRRIERMTQHLGVAAHEEPQDPTP